jgi:predicted nucleotidyltransferase
METMDPVLTAFKASLDKLYGARMVRAVLFGSRARGEARAESDYDVAVFLDDYADRWLESDRIADAAGELMSKTGAFIHAMPYRAEQYDERSPLMHEIRREGLDF